MLMRVGCCFLQDRTVHLHFGFLGFFVRARAQFLHLKRSANQGSLAGTHVGK